MVVKKKIRPDRVDDTSMSQTLCAIVHKDNIKMTIFRNLIVYLLLLCMYVLPSVAVTCVGVHTWCWCIDLVLVSIPCVGV